MIKKKGIIKALSYRVYSTIITVVVAYLLTGSMATSISIGLLDSIVKIISYYFFDEWWAKLTGFTNRPAVIWLTGLSGAGKTTIAQQLVLDFNKKGIYPVLLDGDEIRNAIRQVGFDEDARKRHNLNVGYIASLFEKQGNVVVVSLISPYADTRNEVRAMCQNFIEVHVATHLATCQTRDTKGLYAKALRGEIAEFTGISSPYEPPTSPEVTIQTENLTVEEASRAILSFYRKKRKLPTNS